MKTFLVVTDIIRECTESRWFEAYTNESDARNAMARNIEKIRAEFDGEETEEESVYDEFSMWLEDEGYCTDHGRVELIEVEIK